MKVIWSKLIFFLTCFAFVLFGIIQYNKIMSLRRDDWIEIKKELSKIQKGQDLVFCPGSLKYFANAWEGVLSNYNNKTSPSYKNSFYADYYMIGFCNELNSEIIYKNSTANIYLTKKAYSQKITKNMKDIYQEAKITLEENGQKTSCSLKEKEFYCGKEKLFLNYDFIDGEKKLCLFSNPSKNKKITIDFENINPGKWEFGFLDAGANKVTSINPIAFLVNGKSYSVSRNNRKAEVNMKDKNVNINISTNAERDGLSCISYEEN